MCRISSADYFYSGLTASQSTLFCGAKYSVLHFAQYSKFCSAFASKVFLYDIHWKTLLKKYFQLVSDFIFLPPSFCFTFSFCSYESTKDKLSLYHIWTLVSPFAGVFCKSFFSLTIIGKFRAVCRGISRKFYKKIAEKFSRQPHAKRKSDITQTSFFAFIFNFFAYQIFQIVRANSLYFIAKFRRRCR